MGVRVLYFYVGDDGKLHAYEYTTDEAAVSLTDHITFLEAFSSAFLRLGVQRVFALTIKSKSTLPVMHEFEMPDLSSTVLVQNASWLPNAETSVPTDWGFSALNADGSRSLDAATRCTVTRSTKHYEITKREPGGEVPDKRVPISMTRCIETRSNSYHERPKRHSDLQKDDLMVNGELLDPGTESYRTISYARHLIMAS